MRSDIENLGVLPGMLWRILTIVGVVLSAAGPVRAQSKASESAPDPERTKLEEQFQRTLTGATLVGHFMVTGKASPDELNTEKYSILDVKKIRGDLWLLRSRIEYGDHDVTVPLTLPVRWAGDTPVITIDKLPVPGLGTFTARVLIHQNHYAGTWSGGDHGGLLFGRIVHEKKSEPDTPKK